MKLELSPLGGDPAPAGSEAGGTIWKARTDDPMFIARSPGGEKLSRGWHAATIELQRREGQIDEPRLYLPDAKGRFAEARSVPMAGAGTRFTAEFELPHEVDHIRFDPSRAPCVFTCGPLQLERTRHIQSLFSGVGAAALRAATAVAGRRRVGGATPEMLKQWEENGFLTLPGFYSGAQLDAAQRALEHAWETRAPRIVVDDLMTGQRMRLMDVTEEARREHRFKVNDLYLEHEEVRRLGLNARLTPILQDLLGHVPVICNSLSFQQGSGQPDHHDSLYMMPISHGQLIAIWVALEDCDLNAGPLRYYPGSHRIPPYVFSNGTNRAIEAEMPAWNAYMQEQVQRLGLTPEVFAARRGDVFIWSAYLLHGGSHIVDPKLTRKSIVFHYFSEGDCRGLRFNLVPCSGGYWIHRRHPAVPGRGESDAPPLPA